MQLYFQLFPNITFDIFDPFYTIIYNDNNH